MSKHLLHCKINKLMFSLLSKIVMHKEHVKLSIKEKEQLQELLNKGSLKSRTYKRILSLLELDKGKTYVLVKELVGMSTVSLGKLVKKYKQRGISCIYDSPRPGRPVKIDANQENEVTLLSCSEAPAGYSQWSLRLLADKMVELGHSDSISHTQIGNILKKRKSNPT